MTTPPVLLVGRRLALTEAAVRVVARGGLRALTHRAVDSEAGLPEGSCSSAYRTRLALLTALTQHVGQLLTSAVLALAERLHSVDGLPPEERAAATAAEVVSLFEAMLEDSDLVVVQAELALESRRQPGLAEVLNPWRAGMVAIVERIVADAGKGESARRAETLVAAMQGVVLSGLQQPRSERAAYLTSSISMLLGGLY